MSDEEKKSENDRRNGGVFGKGHEMCVQRA